MKKIIIIFLIIFLTSGCYDYAELNNLAIISGISIDKIGEDFNVVYEILNTVNREENQNEPKVYFAKGSGKTIAEAFLNVSYEVPKEAYFAHVDTIIINEEIAKNYIQEIDDFLIRDIDVRNQFYLVLAPLNTAEEIIKTTNATDPIASTSIKNLIEQTAKKKNITSELNFQKFMAHVLGDYQDSYLTTVYIQDNVLKIGPIAIFDDYKMQTILSLENAANFNVLNNTSHQSTYKITCPDEESKDMVLATSVPAQSEVKFKDNKALYEINMEVKVIENHCDIDLKKIADLEKIQNTLKNTIESQLPNLIAELKKYNSDILEIAHSYYRQTKKKIDFRELEYEFNVNVLINRNGLIFEVKKDANN